MRSAMILGLVAVLASSMSAVGFAAETKSQLHHASGELIGVDAAAKSLTVKEPLKDGKNKNVAFTVDEKTKVTIHGKAGTLEEMKAGDMVKVSYHKMGTENHAAAVAVVESPAKKS